MLGVSVTVYGVLVNLPLSRLVSQTCNYGGAYPDCNPSPCTNGVPSASSCVGGTCANGATNPPSCNNICSNGLPNYPTCTLFSTQTSISCKPVYAYYDSKDMLNGPFGVDCTASVTAATAPTPSGKVVWSSPEQWAGNTSCALTGSQCTTRISPIPGVPYSRVIPFLANYTGDAIHNNSTSQFNITVPSTIYFTYDALPPRDCGCPDYQVTETYFRNSQGVNEYVGFGDYYTLNMTNMQTYSVNINWYSSVNSGSYTCSLALYQFSDTGNAYFQCV